MCNEEMQTLLSGYLDGVNTPEQDAVLEEHLARCEDCRRTLAEYSAIDEAIAASTQAPPMNFTANVMKAISEEEVPQPKKQTRFPLRYGTAIAAVAAVFLIVVSTGNISLPKGSAAAIYPEAPVQQAEVQKPDLSGSAFGTPANAAKSDAVHANVDCAALANDEGIPVAVLYTDKTPEALASAPALSLSGGVRYTVSPGTLDAIAASYDGLIRYEPENADPSAEGIAYLIVIPEK